MASMTLHTDGGARGNPGPAGAGISLCDAENRAPIFEACYWLGELTNNQAEYAGLLRGLDAAARAGADALKIHSDSELMVRQISGVYRVRNANMIPLFEQATRMLKAFPKWSIHHVRREENRRADELANRAMDLRDDVVVVDEIASRPR